MKTLAAQSSGKAGRVIDRILMAVDLSKHSETTALFAAQVAQSFDADLTVAHVFPPEPRYDFAGEGTFRGFEKRRHKSATRLDRLTQKVRQIVPDAESTFLVGDPADEIAAFAYDYDIDLIVTGSHHSKILSSLFGLGEPSKIVHQARCSVLIYAGKGSSEIRSSRDAVRGVEPARTRLGPAAAGNEARSALKTTFAQTPRDQGWQTNADREKN